MNEFFNRNFPSLVKLHKTLKSRLNQDGLVLADAIIAFMLLSVVAILLTGFMGTTIRTSPTIVSDAEDHHASMTAVSQALAKTSVVKDINYDFYSYVPMRSESHPNTYAVYNNYDVNTNSLTAPTTMINELLTNNIITASSINIHVHPTTNQWVQSVITSKLVGAKFTFEPVENLENILGVPSENGFFITNRAETDPFRIKNVETLNYPKEYGKNEVLIYENTIK